VKFIPGNSESAALATAVHLGQVWIIYPFRRNANGKQGVTELLYDFGSKAKDSVAIYTDISDDGKLAYFTFTTGNHVAALDISDLNNIKRLDDPNETQPIIGPHYVKISPDKKVGFTGFCLLPGSLDHLTNVVSEPVGDGLLCAGR
jgi:selenium-binding protein 1